MQTARYRGRLAPSPTGYLHLGHARTFWIAHERARTCGGALILRNEDLDTSRSKQTFADAMLEDLQWLGLGWQEGPDCGGQFAPYVQSKRIHLYHAAFEKLRQSGHLYPCTCSRKDVLRALQAPHQGDEEPIYPGTCRRRPEQEAIIPSASNWRFRVRDGEMIRFSDGSFGEQQFEAGRDFGDFVVWRGDGLSSYQLAVVVDDSAMQITEVVRGADLLLSTARQILLYRALGIEPPAFFHCPLVTDADGVRLAKRYDGLSLRKLRSQGVAPDKLREQFGIQQFFR
jgi:glutamyl/glutaminyl-tRNA synthetase